MARIAPKDISDIQDDIPEAEKKSGVVLNRTRTMAHVAGLPRTIASVERFIGEHGSLSPEVKAVVIASTVRRSPYELTRLRPDLLAAGLTSDILEAIEEEDWTEPTLSEHQKIAFRFALMYDAGHGIPDAIYEELQESFSVPEIIELAAVCGHYGGLARMAIALSFDMEE